ncbi:MAG: polyprenyl synthetase family protein, partial [Finegoldia magna]|nr:polyprenyl synthetase family protein [Finegoldia magna]
MNKKEIVDLINTSLKNLKFSDDKIGEAMRYTLIDDGAKRLRPLLFLLTFQMFNNSVIESVNYALAIELIHNYSLVHDDLECMDNDDYRRGKLTVHKKYGEDIAILVGDALLNYSFEVLTQSIKNDIDAKSANYIVSKSGC